MKKNKIILSRKKVLFKPNLSNTRENILYKKLPVNFTLAQKGRCYTALHTRFRVSKKNYINIFIYGRKKTLKSLKENTFLTGELVIIETCLHDSIHFFVDVPDEKNLPILRLVYDDFVIPQKEKFIQIVPPQGGNILLEKIKKAV